jgi:hypothetical protein
MRQAGLRKSLQRALELLTAVTLPELPDRQLQTSHLLCSAANLVRLWSAGVPLLKIGSRDTHKEPEHLVPSLTVEQPAHEPDVERWLRLADLLLSKPADDKAA